MKPGRPISSLVAVHREVEACIYDPERSHVVVPIEDNALLVDGRRSLAKIRADTGTPAAILAAKEQTRGEHEPADVELHPHRAGE